MKNQMIKRLIDGMIVVTLLAALTQTASALPNPVGAPDAGSTVGMMGAACAGLIALRARLRR